MQKVKLYSKNILIPTYEVKSEDKEAPLLDEFSPREAPIYPYTTQEVLSEKKIDKEYLAVYLENDYIKLTFLPELNGRLYSAYDKVNKNELFYANPVIKPGLFAVRGAWPAVGVEFNFPNSHTTTTLEKVAWETEQYDDGSASIIVGDIEKTCRMGWSVEIKLSPDSNLIEMESKLYNPTDFPQRYYYWINAACPVFKNTEFIYPPSTKRLLTHPPMDASRLAFLNWPKHEGKNINYFKNINQHFPVFAEKMDEDFYGIYHHDQEYGLAHIADHSLVRGRKLWMFGNARDGKIFIDLLSDDSADYCELQTGPFTLQSDYRMLYPGRMYVQRDYWLPVASTGGFNLACREFAAKIKPEKNFASVVICSGAKLENAKATVKYKGNVISEKNFDTEIAVATNFETDYTTDAEIIFSNSNGEILAVWNSVKTSKENILNEPKLINENAFLKGKYFEEQGKVKTAKAIYSDAYNDIGSKLAGARLDYSNGLNDKALSLLKDILETDRNNPEALIMAGNIYSEQGEFLKAEKCFSNAADTNQYRDRALLGISATAVMRRQYHRALNILDELTDYGLRDARIFSFKAFCLRKINKNSISIIKEAERMFFIDPLLMGEMKHAGMTSCSDNQLTIEAACVYVKLKHYNDALKLLEKQNDILSIYFRAWLMDLCEDHISAQNLLKKAETLIWEGCFAYRNETENALRFAVKENPRNNTANYQLGCILAYKNRWQEAISCWERVKGSHLAEASRNIALYYWKIKPDHQLAAKYYNLAASNSCSSKCLIEAEMFFEHIKDNSKRLEVFDGYETFLEQDSRVKLAYTKALLANSMFDQAENIMLNNNFSLCEGKMLSRELYETTFSSLAKEALKTKDLVRAAEYFLQAAKYPENIGIGKPSNNKEAEWYFKAGQAYLEAKMPEEAAICFEKGSEEGDFLDIDFFPLKNVIWETNWENIDSRYWKNLLFRSFCLIKLDERQKAEVIILKIIKYFEHLKHTRREDTKEYILFKKLYKNIEP